MCDKQNKERCLRIFTIAILILLSVRKIYNLSKLFNFLNLIFNFIFWATVTDNFAYHIIIASMFLSLCSIGVTILGFFNFLELCNIIEHPVRRCLHISVSLIIIIESLLFQQS